MEDIIYGRNTVLSALNAKGRKINKALISKSIKDDRFLSLVKAQNIPFELVDNKVLDKISKNANHQGVILKLNPFEYVEEDLLLSSLSKKEKSLVVILDGIEDPVNFGSIIRTSSCFNVDGIFISQNRQVGVTSVVSKVATGAEEYVPICRVVNLNRLVEKLKKGGYWVYATDGSGQEDYSKQDYPNKTAVILGSEGRGISRLLLQNSDYVIKIPISGPITSLNANIALAIVLAEVNKKLFS